MEVCVALEKMVKQTVAGDFESWRRLVLLWWSHSCGILWALYVVNKPGEHITIPVPTYCSEPRTALFGNLDALYNSLAVSFPVKHPLVQVAAGERQKSSCASHESEPDSLSSALAYLPMASSAGCHWCNEL